MIFRKYLVGKIKKKSIHFVIKLEQNNGLFFTGTGEQTDGYAHAVYQQLVTILPTTFE